MELQARINKFVIASQRHFILKIAVNTRFLLKDKLEGIGTFTHETLKIMVLGHPEDTFYFIFDRSYDNSFVYAKNVIPFVISPPARHPFLWYIWFEFSITRLLKKINPDVFLSTDGYACLKTKTPTTLVIHDLAFEHFPKDIGFLARKYYQYFVPKFIKKAKQIVTVSHFTKNDILSTYKHRQNNIDVTCNAAASVFKPIPEKLKDRIKQKWASGKEYFVYVGALHPRKNINRLLLAFDDFKIKTKSETKLVIVGRKAWSTIEMENTFLNMEHQNEVIFTGRLSQQELIETLGASLCLAYIPYFEGFGIPLIEAQACHIPVMTSNTSSLAEVANESAYLVDPFNVSEISLGFTKLDADTDYRNNLIEKGKENIKRYSWEIASDILYKSIQKTTK